MAGLTNKLPEELQTLRERGLDALGKLPEADPDMSSWIAPSSSKDAEGKQSARAAYFNTYGFHVARGFVSEEKAAEMIGRMTELVEEFWHPGDPAQVSAQRSDE